MPCFHAHVCSARACRLYYENEGFSVMNLILKLHFGRFACLAVVAGLILFAGRATAQSAADAAKIAASLPSDTHAVIDGLCGLRELPDAAWKLHSGDLAHGEALNLDESEWKPIAIGSLAPKDA